MRTFKETVELYNKLENDLLHGGYSGDFIEEHIGSELARLIISDIKLEENFIDQVCVNEEELTNTLRYVLATGLLFGKLKKDNKNGN